MRIVGLLYDNYVENGNISVINDIIDYIDIINNTTKHHIKHNIKTNLCIYSDKITPTEMLTFYFIAKVVGYFDNIHSNKPIHRLVRTDVEFDYSNIPTDYPDEELHHSPDKFTDNLYANENATKFQQIIRKFENMENSDPASIPVSSPPEVRSVRLVINYLTFNFDMYTHLKNIHEFLIKTFDRDVNIVLMDTAGDPFWISLDVVDTPQSDEIISPARILRYS